MSKKITTTTPPATYNKEQGWHHNTALGCDLKTILSSDRIMKVEKSYQGILRRGPKNMLDSLPNSFNEAQLEALRQELGKSKEGTRGQLNQWMFRRFITYSNQTGLYTKTDSYLKTTE